MERAFRGDRAGVDADLDVDLEAELDALEELLPALGRGPRQREHRTAREIARRLLARFGAELGGGVGLPAALRARFEAALGVDLSEVKLHDDAGAAAAASALGARAFAVGQDVFFDRGELDPSSADGVRLIAHEVIHTVQQRGAAPASELAHTRSGDATEREADELAGDLVRGVPVAREVAAAPLALAGEWRRGQALPDQPEEPNSVDLGNTRGSRRRRPRPVRMYHFAGLDRSQSVVLVSGVHGNERGAVEVVDIILDHLRHGLQPRYDLYVIPTLFPDNVASGHRESPAMRGRAGGRVDPNRNLPSGGSEHQVLPENRMLIDAVEHRIQPRPTRIIQVHGTTRPELAGFSRDVRAGDPAGTQADAELVGEMAGRMRERNREDGRPEQRSAHGTADDAGWEGGLHRGQSPDEQGASLGQYFGGQGMSVITVETDGNEASHDRGARPDRREELMDIAAVIEELLIGPQARPMSRAPTAPSTSPTPAAPPTSPTAPVQRTADGSPHVHPAELHAVAAAGLSSSGGALPYADAIQRAFGHHDVSGVRAHIGGVAGEAAAAIGARAYASGERVAFAREPDLFLVAHEVAHVIQQRAGVDVEGGVGADGDAHEQHADAVAAAVVRGESAEPLLDTYRGTASGVQRKVIQRFGDRELRERQARQEWSRAQIHGPLAEVDASVEDAIRANQALRFSEPNLGVLRQALGLPRNPPLIDRRFVQAVRRVQLGGAVIETDRAGNDAEGNRPADVGPSPGASGVLDLATVMRLDLSAHVNRNARGSYRGAPWNHFSEAEVADIRAHLEGPLGIGEADLHTVAHGRRIRVEVSAHFLERAAAWQLWTYRSSAGVVLGRLGSRELSDLGVGVPVRQRPAAAEPARDGAASGSEQQGASSSEQHGASGSERQGPAPSAAMPDERAAESEAEPALPSMEERLGEVRRARDQLRRLLGRRSAAHRHGNQAEEAAIDRELSTKMAEIRTRIESLELPRTDFSGSQQYERPANQARHMLDELAYILDESAPAPRTDAQRRAADAEQSTPLERRSEEEARAELAREDVVVRDHTQITHEGWDHRVAGDAPPERTAQIGDANAEAMNALRARMLPHRDRLRAAIRASRREPDGVTAALDALAAEPFAHDPAWHPPGSQPNERLRQAWDPGHRPDLLAAGTAASLDAGARVRLARAWLNWLNGAIGELGTGQGRGEIHRQRGYATTDPRRIGNPDAVEVDFHRTGVTITTNEGNPLATHRMRLDPQFADAFLRFLRQIQGLGVTEIRTAGFIRRPISPADTHPRGQACDITGFQIGDQLLHLRSGYPMDPPAEGDAEAQARYNDIRRGHSDWFDHTGRIGDMTHEQVMHAITNIMRTYFSTIVGPGNDQRHMGHWHVELTSTGRTGPQVRAQMNDRDQPDFVRDRADRRAPDWVTPDERASFPDEESE